MFLFPKLKENLPGTHFSESKDEIAPVNEWLAEQTIFFPKTSKLKAF